MALRTPSLVAIRQSLSTGAKGVAQVSEETGLAPRTVYRALEELPVHAHREGKNVVYSLSENALPEASVHPSPKLPTLRSFNETQSWGEDAETITKGESAEEVIQWAMETAQKFVDLAAAIRPHRDSPDWFKLAGG